MNRLKQSAALVALAVLTGAAYAQEQPSNSSAAADSEVIVSTRTPTDAEQTKLNQILKSSQPSSQELAELKQMAQAGLRFGQKRFSSDFGFNEASVKALSQMIDAERSSYSEEFKAKLTVVLGCYLGQALITKNGGEWLVMGDGSFAVALTGGQIIWPISRVNQQLQEGSDRSIYALYLTAQSAQ